MALKPGHKKFGGRAKGTPNKKTLALLERVEASGKDPFDVMIELLSDSDAGMRLAAAKELCQYLYPKRKAIEVSGPDGAAVDVNSGETSELVGEFKKMVAGYNNERNQK